MSETLLNEANDKSDDFPDKKQESSFLLKSSMLRPSAFANSNNGSSGSASSLLKPSSFQLKASSLSAAPSKAESEAPVESEASKPSEADNQNEETKPLCSKIAAEVVQEEPPVAAKENESKTNTKATPTIPGLNLFAKTGSATTNLFANAATKASSIPRNNNESNISFVFGQKIHERTAGATENASANEDDSNLTPGDSTKELFAAAVASSPPATDSNANATTTSSTTSSTASRVEDLTKAAKAYEESRGPKRKYDEVETFTGEEEEINIYDINCKLYAFVASNWEERGPGSLRLNDTKGSKESNSKCSRVVFRTRGNLRVLLNTKVWSGMVVEKPSPKSLRLTAIDSVDGQVRIWLAMARPEEITTLHSALQKRIDAEKEKTDEEPTALDVPNVPKATAESSDIDEPSSKRDKAD